MAYIIESSSLPLDLGVELGRGGEGAVFEVAGDANSVAKIYHATHRTVERHAKISAMIANPPVDGMRAAKPPHVSIAWPTGVLLGDARKFAGFLMPRIEQSPDIYKVYNPQLRAKYYPEFDWRYLHRSAINLAAAMQAVHRKKYVLGDVNQKNILVTRQALVTLVDTDSFQVREADGRVLRSMVGSPEYTPPELQGILLSSIDREAHHDYFGLAVLIFQLLMEGHHPFAGRPLDPSFAPDGNIQLECIKNGIFPYINNKTVAPPPSAPAFSALHPAIQYRFQKTFVLGYAHPLERSTALEWISALDEAQNTLVRCALNPQHYFSKHHPSCPWCDRAKIRQDATAKVNLAAQTHASANTKPVVKAALDKHTDQASVPAALILSFIPSAANFVLMGGVGYFFLAQLTKGALAIGACLAAQAYGWKYAHVLNVITALDAFVLTYKQQRGKKLGEFDFGLGPFEIALVAWIGSAMVINGIL